MPGTRAGIGDGVGVGVIVWMEAIIVVSISQVRSGGEGGGHLLAVLLGEVRERIGVPIQQPDAWARAGGVPGASWTGQQQSNHWRHWTDD